MASRSFCLSTKNYNQFGNEDEEDDDDLLSKKDVQRLTNLWKSMKDSKKHLNNSKSVINASFLNTNQHQMNNSFNNITMKQADDSICEQYATNNNDISLNISKIPHVPKQTDAILLQKAKEQNKQLIKKQKEGEAEIEQCHQKIAKLANQNQTQQKQIADMQQKLEQYAHSQKEILEKSRVNTNMIEQSLEDKDRVLEDLRTQHAESKDQVQRMINSNKQIMNENSKLIDQLESKTIENDRLKEKLSKVEKCLDEVYNEKQANGIATVEIDYLKSDIERLLKLLRSTQEYKELSYMAEESMSIRYLKNNPNFLKNYRLNTSNGGQAEQKTSTIKRNCCSCSTHQKQQEDKTIQNEKQLWVPRDAFQFTYDLSLKHNKKFTEDVIEELLFGLNQIWGHREKLFLDKAKKQYENENKELKKQLNKNLPYDGVQARKKIQRLKSEMSRTRKENDFNILNTSNTLPPSRGGSLNGTNGHQCKEKIIYFQDALKLFQEYESDLRMCKDELQESKNKMKQINEEISLYDKVIYMEGALWMIEKIITEVNKAKQTSFNTMNQYQLDLEKVLLVFNSNPDDFDSNCLMKISKSLLSTHSSMNEQLIEKFLNLKESTEKQIEKSSKIQQKLKKQKRHEYKQQQNYSQNQQQENQNNQSEQGDDYDRDQNISSAAATNSYICSNSYNKQVHNQHYNQYSNQGNQMYSGNQANPNESNTTTQRISPNLIPTVHNTQSVYSSVQNQNNYLSENNKSYNQIDSSSHRQNNHYSTNSTPIQQYYSQHSHYPNSRSKEVLEDSFNQRPSREK